MKKITIFLFWITAISQHLAGQTPSTITGTVNDEAGLPVPFASVSVTDAANSSVVTGTVTSTDGSFIIQSPPPGIYKLKTTAVGYTDYESATFEIRTGEAKDFGTVVLKKDTQQLQEVVVEALRPQIRQEADKMVVQVDGTALASGNTAFAVLSRIPGVFVDPEGNIRLNGKGGVTVMLDGKLTYMSAADLRTLLEGMAAENVKNIEVITNPSAKYDAEGTSGILNINLKKNSRTGTSGSVYSGAVHNFKQFGYNYGANVNHKSGKWNSFLFTDGAQRAGGREATFTRVFYGESETVYFDQTAEGNYFNTGMPSIRLGSDFTVNDRHSIGGMASFLTNTGDNEFLTDTYIGSSPQTPAQFIDADNISRNTYRNLRANLHYLMKIDTLGTTLSSDADYIRIWNRGYAHFYNYFTELPDGPTTQDFLYTETPNGFDVYSVKADFTHPFAKEQTIEAGFKASRVLSDNDSRFYFDNGVREPDPSRTNHFVYAENIYAAYASWSGRLSKNLTVKTGLRVENTQSEGKSYTTQQENSRNYTDLFPSVFLQQKVTDNYEINYSYSRRITRPNYGSLNPFRAYRDPYTWTAGNPGLRPQYTHSFSISQGFKKTYYLTIGYDYDHDAMAEIPILDPENATTVYTTGNVDDGQTANLTVLIPVAITKWWETQNTGLLYYNKFTMADENGKLVNEQVSVMLQSSHVIKLPWGLRMELNLQYQGPQAYGLYHMEGMHRVDAAIKKSFFGKKLDVTLRGNDLFKGWRYNWTTDINGNVNDFDQYFRIRNVGLSLRYNFSKGLKVDGVKDRKVEEVNRI